MHCSYLLAESRRLPRSNSKRIIGLRVRSFGPEKPLVPYRILRTPNKPGPWSCNSPVVGLISIAFWYDWSPNPFVRAKGRPCPDLDIRHRSWVQLQRAFQFGNRLGSFPKRCIRCPTKNELRAIVVQPRGLLGAARLFATETILFLVVHDEAGIGDTAYASANPASFSALARIVMEIGCSFTSCWRASRRSLQVQFVGSIFSVGSAWRERTLRWWLESQSFDNSARSGLRG